MMRVSVRKDDPGYANWRDEYTGKMKVYVDGQEVPLVHTADEEEGRAWGWTPGEDGGPFYDPEADGPAETVYEGEVEIVFEAAG